MPWETCKRFTECHICKRVMAKGDGRFSYAEVGRQVYWKVTRYICMICAEKKFGRDNVPRDLIVASDFNRWEDQNGVNTGTVKRWLRPIIHEMKGE